MLDEYQKQGIGAIEIFAPYWGGDQYGALDPYAYCIVDPDIGTMEDFLKLIRECHRREMAVIIFVNVGYSAMQNVDFLKAQDDVRRGIESRETRLFLWSESEQSPPPKTLSCEFGKEPDGHWVYSLRAEKYYWVKWHGFQNDVALPQYNFGAPEWQEECKKIIEFWMETGIDGMIIDAPFAYLNCGFRENNQCITDVIRRYPNQYIQPEGGGAAGEELQAWIRECGYNSLQDYSICRFSHPATLIGEAILKGDASCLEEAFRGWRDRVVQMGGTTYLGVLWDAPLTEDQRLLELITVVTSGAILHDDCKLMWTGWSPNTRKRLADILKLCASVESLRMNGHRRLLHDTDGWYAFARSGTQGTESIVILNYTDEEKSVSIPGEKEKYHNALTGEAADGGQISLTLPPYGYAVYLPEV